MYNDILTTDIDFKEEIRKYREILKEAKQMILDERQKYIELEIVKNNYVKDAKKFAEVIDKYRKKFNVQDFDTLDEED